MTDTEKRAHDLAIAMLETTIKSMLNQSDGKMRETPTDIYLMLYNCYLSELSEHFNSSGKQHAT